MSENEVIIELVLYDGFYMILVNYIIGSRLIFLKEFLFLINMIVNGIFFLFLLF